MEITRWFSLVTVIFCILLVTLMIQRGKQGKKTYLRELAAVAAIPEAVRRATEMGRAVFYAPGAKSITHGTYGGATIAGLTILRYVSKLCAEQQTPLEVYICGAASMPIASEAVRLACIEANKPEEIQRQKIHYIGEAENQLPFAAAMIREKAGSCIQFGDAGATTMVVLSSAAYEGIFQIMGNTQTSNCCWLPPMSDYYVMCDGPQAAAAYVSEDPEIMNTVLATDILKIIVVGLVLVGLVLQLGFNINFSKLLMS